MPRPKGSFKTPSLTLHKPSGRARVCIDGKDQYCGVYGTLEAQQKYERLIAERVLRGKQTATAEPAAATSSGPTVSQVIAAFWQHAQAYYRKLDGTPTSEVDTLRQALRPLRRIYGATPAREFGPLALKALRVEMLKPREERDEKTGEVTTRPGWCRTFINRQIARIKLMFKWATENELLLPSVYHGLSTVGGLRKGRSNARESDQVKPAPDHAIETILPRVSRHVRRRFDCSYSPARGPARPSSCGPATSTRPGPCGYRPHRHKGEHHEHEREIRVGPKAQAEIARQRFTTPS